MIRRLLKGLLVLAALVALGVVAFAYMGPVIFPAEFAAPQHEIHIPVTLGAEPGR